MGLQRNTTDQREDMSATDGTRGRYDAATAGGGQQVLCPNPAAGDAPARRERLRPVKSASEMCSPCEQRNQLKTLQTSEDGTFESCVRP